ncbi:MAG TPA: serine/threonine-protein kinase [Acidimicrobiales bacterium]|nr:serine/threonine-protein kinase [Acidimicrobiales bacterium]
MPGFDQMIQPPGVGRVLAGRYRLVAPIARGGMAEVWEAHDEVLSRPVAAKVLQSHLAADGIFLERFRREAVTAARLAHPGIVATFDTGFDQGTAFIVMELVRGRNLREWLDSYGRMEPWQAVAVARQVADALGYAHQAGLVHRDVKPANILLIEDEWGGLRVKVTDFGIAKAGQESGADLTRTGMVLGTPKYLSPEQIRGAEPDPRADVYSLGVVLYEMLVGAPPYVGETDMATALAHLGDKVPKPSASVRGLPSGLDKVVVELLAKSPDRRIPSAIEARRRLDALGPLAPPAAPGRRGARRSGSPPLRVPSPTPTPTPMPTAGPSPAAPNRAAPSPAAPFPAAPFPSAPGPSAPGPTAAPIPAPPPPAAAARAATNASPVPPPVEVPPLGVPAWRANGTPPPARPADATRLSPSDQAAANGAATTYMPAHGGGQGHTTVFERPARGRGTDEFDPREMAPPARRYHRSEKTAGLVVLALAAVGALVGGILLATSGSPHHSSQGGTSSTVHLGQGVSISQVGVFMDNRRTPDNPDKATLTIDGNPSTTWSTDQYHSPTFGNLYDGIGLEIQLQSATALGHLSVTSPTSGWAASTYVSATPISSGQSISAWGTATDSKSGIGGNTTFNLAGRQGQYVLLWITNLGPADMAQVAELAVTR